MFHFDTSVNINIKFQAYQEICLSRAPGLQMCPHLLFFFLHLLYMIGHKTILLLLSDGALSLQVYQAPCIESTGFKSIFLNQFLPRISSESGHMSRNATSHSCLNLPQSEDQCICQKNTQVKILSYQHQCLLKEQSKDGYERKHHDW